MLWTSGAPIGTSDQHVQRFMPIAPVEAAHSTRNCRVASVTFERWTFPTKIAC